MTATTSPTGLLRDSALIGCSITVDDKAEPRKEGEPLGLGLVRLISPPSSGLPLMSIPAQGGKRKKNRSVAAGGLFCSHL